MSKMPEDSSYQIPARLAIQLASALASAARIQTREQFLLWADAQLRPLVPHTVLVCGQVELGKAALGIRQLLRHCYEPDKTVSSSGAQAQKGSASNTFWKSHATSPTH